MSAPGLGLSDELLELDDSAGVAAALLALASQARRSVEIVSRHLDPVLYDTDAFATALRALVVGSRRAEVRVLVLNPTPIVSRGHRLVELAQRLSSYIALRVPGPEHRELNEAWLVADDTGYLHRRYSDRFEATANFSDRRHATHLAHRFEEVWQRAQPDPNLRRLHI